MAGIDILNQFPNSRMAAAANLGQSQFRSVEAGPVVAGLKSGSAVLTGVAGNTSTAQLLALCGLTTSFAAIVLTITTAIGDVFISQGGVTTKYRQGQAATYRNVSLSQNQLQVGTIAGDVVTINYVGV